MFYSDLAKLLLLLVHFLARHASTPIILLSMLDLACGMALFFGCYIRMTHNGRVCAGDYLRETDS